MDFILHIVARITTFIIGLMCIGYGLVQLRNGWTLIRLLIKERRALVFWVLPVWLFVVVICGFAGISFLLMS